MQPEKLPRGVMPRCRAGLRPGLRLLCLGLLGTVLLASETLSLDGADWRLLPDLTDQGRTAGWDRHIPPLATTTTVPAVMQQDLPGYHGIAWYWKTFQADPPLQDTRSFLRFHGVNYQCEVWLNSQPLGSHEGGEGPFLFETTGTLHAGENLLALRVIAPLFDRAIDGMKKLETPRTAGCVLQHDVLHDRVEQKTPRVTASLRARCAMWHSQVPTRRLRTRPERITDAHNHPLAQESAAHKSLKCELSRPLNCSRKSLT